MRYGFARSLSFRATFRAGPHDAMQVLVKQCVSRLQLDKEASLSTRRGATSWRYFIEGRLGSMRTVCVVRGDSFHSASTAFLNASLSACRTFGRLAGKDLAVSQGGSSASGLVSLCAA